MKPMLGVGRRSRKLPGVLLIGIGNPDRCDDAVGLVVARSLSAKNLPDLTIVESRGDGTALAELWKDAESVILVDAVCSGAPPGTVHRLNGLEDALPAQMFRCSTHNFGVGEAVELARSLGQLPPRLLIYGIEGKNFDLGIGLTREVVGAARRVVTTITQELRSNRARHKRRQSRSVAGHAAHQ